MTARTICLAIRVVKNTLTDTRSKVTGRRPRGEWLSGSPASEAEGSRQVASHRSGIRSSPAVWLEAGLLT